MKIFGAATVFQVKNLETSLKFYRDILGFVEDFQFGEYAGVHLGELHLHLCAHTVWKRPSGGGSVSVFGDEVDTYYTTLRSRGAKIELEPADEPYGMRDFVVSDPDGNLLTFGCELSAGRGATPEVDSREEAQIETRLKQARPARAKS